MSVSKKVKLLAPGDIFGQWTVQGFSHIEDSKAKLAMYNVLCSCGAAHIVAGTVLRTGKSTKCRACNGRERGRKGLYTQNRGDPVYFIRCGDYIKIGSSKDINRRLRDLGSSNPYPLFLICKEENEEMWHKVFSHRHHKGEWYHFPDGGACEIV